MGLLNDPFGKETINLLNKKLTEKTDELTRKESALQACHLSKIKAEEDFKTAKVTLAKKDGEIVALKRLLEDSQSTNIQLGNDLRLHRLATTELRLALDEKAKTDTAEIAKLKRQAEVAQTAYLEVQDRLKRLGEIRSEKDRDHLEREKRLSADYAALALEKKSLEGQQASLRAKEEYWQNTVAPKLRIYEQYSGLDHFEQTLNNRRKKLDELQRTIPEREAALQRREAALERKEATDRALVQRKEALDAREAKLAADEEELQARTTLFRGQQLQLKVHSEKLAKKSRELSTLKRRIQNLDAEIAKLDSARKDLAKQEKQSARDRAKLLADLKQREISLSKLNTEMQQRNSNLAGRAKRIEHAEQQTAELKRVIAKLKTEVKDLSAAIEVLYRERDEATTTLKAKEDECLRLQSRNQRILEKLKIGESGAGSASFMYKPMILAWLLQDGDPVTAHVNNGWIGCTGEGPWDDQVFFKAVEDLGYCPYLMPDDDLEHLVVGRAGWSKADLLAQIDARAGRPLRIYSQEMFLSKLVTGRDPFDAYDADLLHAFAEDHPALQFLKALPEPWPEVSSQTTEETEEIFEVTNEDSGVSESPLHILGYRVGTTSRLSVEDRRKILTECFLSRELSFSSDSDAAYRKNWGRGGGAQRLYRMAVHIKSLAEGRVGRDPRKRQARIDWVNDLKWLKGKFFANHQSRFTWPGA